MLIQARSDSKNQTMVTLLPRVIAFAICLASSSVQAAPPTLNLGPKPSFGLFQPRVTVDISSEQGGTSFGPSTNTFLLDTAANGLVIFPPATQELVDNGLVNEGTYEEAGVSGTSIFQVSAPYHLTFAGTGGPTQHLSEARFMSGANAVDPTGLMGLNGIVGMPGMVGKVTSIDNRTREGAPSLSMGVSFSDSIPSTSTHRLSIPFTQTVFEPEGEEGPFPSWSSALPTVTLNGFNGEKESSTPIVFDTGAQLTIISEAYAHSLGLDANGNGDFTDEATATVPISGATGQIEAPVLVVDRMSLPTDQGYELSWTSAEVIVLDIHPKIAGVLGSDFLSDDGGLDLSFLGGGGSGGLGGLGDLLGGGGLGDLGDLLGGLGDLGDLLGGGTGGIDLDDLLGDLGGLLGGASGEDDPTDPLDDLLGGLGGLGGTGGDLFASFPLESNFDQIHLDFRNYPEGEGAVYFDLNQQVSSSILNGDHVFDVHDIDDMTTAIGSTDTRFDLTGDGVVDAADRESLLTDVLQVIAGDNDMDGDVDFADFLLTSDSFGQSSGWMGGDYDGDGKTLFADFLLLSHNFGATTAAQSVPEPSTNMLAVLAVFATLICLRRVR